MYIKSHSVSQSVSQCRAFKMRIIQLLLCFVASAFALANDLQAEKCSNGVCPMDVDIWQEAMKKMETMVRPMNNDVIARVYTNVTAILEYATGQIVASVETVETTIEIGEEGQLIVTDALVAYTKGTGVNDFETTLVLVTEEEITQPLNGTEISVEVGRGEIYERVPESNLTRVSNVSFTGFGSMVQLTEKVRSYEYENVMIIGDGSIATRDTEFVDVTEVQTEDRVILYGTETVITHVANAVAATTTTRVASEFPLPGEDGPIKEILEGITIVGEALDTFISEGEGHLVYVEESIKATGQRKLFGPRQLLRKLSRFH